MLKFGYLITRLLPLAFAPDDSAHRFDIVFRESVSRRTMFLRIEIIFRLCEPPRHNIFANLRYKRPVNLLVTREFQRNYVRSGDLTPRACRDCR